MGATGKSLAGTSGSTQMPLPIEEEETQSESVHQFSDDIYETMQWFADPDNSNQTEWENNYEKDAYNGMKDFTGSSYDGYFKQLYTTPWKDIPPEYRKKIGALSNWIRNYELKHPIEVNRRTDFQIFGAAKGAQMSMEQLKALEGKVIVNNSFLSTSAATKGIGISSSMVDLKIHVPAGKGWGSFVGKSGLSSMGSSEKEFLLNNQLAFKVGKTTYNESTGRMQVDMTIVGRTKHQVFNK